MSGEGEKKKKRKERESTGSTKSVDVEQTLKKRRHFDKNAVREASDDEDSASEYSSEKSDYDLRTILLKSIKKQVKLLNTIVKKQDGFEIKRS